MIVTLQLGHLTHDVDLGVESVAYQDEASSA